MGLMRGEEKRKRGNWDERQVEEERCDAGEKMEEEKRGGYGEEHGSVCRHTPAAGNGFALDAIDGFEAAGAMGGRPEGGRSSGTGTVGAAEREGEIENEREGTDNYQYAETEG